MTHRRAVPLQTRAAGNDGWASIRRANGGRQAGPSRSSLLLKRLLWRQWRHRTCTTNSTAFTTNPLRPHASPLAPSRVLDLDPTIAAAWPVRRSKALRHNALAAERAGQFVDDCAVDFEMAVECDAGLSAAQWPFESSFANLVRLAPQILAIELKQVKSAESDGVVVLPPFRIISNTERPFSPPGDRLAVDYAGSRRETRDSCQD
jgi:hypothetical protein